MFGTTASFVELHTRLHSVPAAGLAGGLDGIVGYANKDDASHEARPPKHTPKKKDHDVPAEGTVVFFLRPTF